MYFMQKTISLSENKQFKLLYNRGKSFVYPFFVLYIRPNRFPYNRLGITVGKKVGNAVKRNRAKRVIKEAYRLLETELCIGYDFVLVARSKTPFVSMNVIKKDLAAVFKRQQLLLSTKEKNI